jgi:hypothetical protein
VLWWLSRLFDLFKLQLLQSAVCSLQSAVCTVPWPCAHRLRKSGPCTLHRNLLNTIKTCHTQARRSSVRTILAHLQRRPRLSGLLQHHSILTRSARARSLAVLAYELEIKVHSFTPKSWSAAAIESLNHPLYSIRTFLRHCSRLSSFPRPGGLVERGQKSSCVLFAGGDRAMERVADCFFLQEVGGMP